MSNLSEYLNKQRITQNEFAKRIGLTQATVSRLCRRALRPSLKTAFDIEKNTAGAVPASSWFETECGAEMGSAVADQSENATSSESAA